MLYSTVSVGKTPSADACILSIREPQTESSNDASTQNDETPFSLEETLVVQTFAFTIMKL